ncbi:hypothetical protein GCM10007382_25720 [Salinibacterium xinjiangense]|uniref:Right handed beta helix region n=1 Tax=Salinibacterium xinjiangense TaxID=386302 RepID=A0A2C9A1F4_9MICO|nr:right-handed parallel beta-helix repeat-containing protein [Salinibacterium xinjiangense]GGL04737.1 hypothetical protein GCM10007382_25720 [Salinibacterium xinjiangense]SOE72880.1 Right handed beta helix region [Salinibacterium xinjiangense]
MSRVRAGLIGASVGVAVGAILVGLVVNGVDFGDVKPDAVGRNEIAANGTIQGDLYSGTPELESRLVQIEDERLVYARTAASVARWGDISTDGPFRLDTGAAFTLVLTARAEPYTIEDLLALAPNTFVAQDANTYLLSESVVVMEGATLALNADRGVTIRMESDASKFVSIVTLGGALTIAGSDLAPVSMLSWDSQLAAPDTVTDDGRAYIRAIGGQATLSDADFANLGFWSGNTGGLALTGSEAAGPFNVADMSALTDKAAPEVAGAFLLPAGALKGDVSAPTVSPLVSAKVDNVSIDGNAFGLFVTSAVNVRVSHSDITNSLVDGLVFHRFVKDSTVIDTTSSNNAVDGFTLARSSTGVIFDRVTASANGRNGISLDGQPLADGPSAIGSEVESYGDNRITDSDLLENGRYGVEISGGRDVTVAANRIASNQVGVVINHGSFGAIIKNNDFGEQGLQSVAVRDGVMQAAVSNNTFAGGDTAIYVRNAGVAITDNTLTSLSNHGVTVMGDAGAVSVVGNSISGYGTLPIYDREAVGFTPGINDLDGWHPATTPAAVLKSIFRPLTIIWLVLALLLLATMVGPRSLRFGAYRHPYANRAPLQTLSKGVIARHSVSRVSE